MKDIESSRKTGGSFVSMAHITSESTACRSVAGEPETVAHRYNYVHGDLPMIARLLALTLIAACISLAPAQTSQAPALPKQPLTALPYSPSLDLTNLDRAANPCVDFYQFTCGGWRKDNPIPADQAAWSVYAKLANENRQFLWSILEEDAKLKDRTPAQQKIGDYYAACMNTDAIHARGLQPLKPELDRIAQ